MNKGIGFKVFWESPTLFDVEQDNIKSFYLPLGGVPIPTQSGGSSTWGNIGGNIDNQTDLKFKLDSKQDTLPTNGDGTKFLSDDGTYKSVSVDTNDFYTKEDTNTLLNNKVDKEVNKGLSTNDYTTLDKDKLSNIEEEATKNSSDSYLLDRVNHTGVQPISSVEGLQDELDSIPEDLNQLTDDDNLLFDKDYNSLTNKPTIPTNNNQLINGEEFIKDAPKDSKQYARKDGSWSEITSSGGGVTETEVKGWISERVATGSSVANSVATHSGALSVGGGISRGNNSVQVGSGATANVNSVAVGYYASNVESNSVSVGFNAKSNNFYGVCVGSRTVAQHSSTVVGYQASNSTVAHTNCILLGSNTAVTAANQNQIGNTTTTTYVYGSVQDRSDVRDKTDIKDVSLGLDFLNKLRPVEYKWDYREDYFKDIAPNRDDFETEEEYQVVYESARKEFFTNPIKDGSKTRTRYHTGLIAQELKQTLDDLSIDFGGFQHHQEKGGLDVMSIGYTEFIAVLIKSVQELSDKCNELKGEIDELRKDIQ